MKKAEEIEDISARRVLEPLTWLLQLVSGLILAVLITIHFYITHLASHEAISYAAVVERMSSGSYKLMYAVLLLFVTFHAFNGLRAIVLDTNFGANNRTATNAVAMLLFIVVLLCGAYLLYTI